MEWTIFGQSKRTYYCRGVLARWDQGPLRAGFLSTSTPSGGSSRPRQPSPSSHVMWQSVAIFFVVVRASPLAVSQRTTLVHRCIVQYLFEFASSKHLRFGAHLTRSIFIKVRLGQEPWKALLGLRGRLGWAKMTSSAMTSCVQYTFESTYAHAGMTSHSRTRDRAKVQPP